MKYAIASCVVLALCLIVGVLVVRAVNKRRTTPWALWARALLSVACAVVLLVVVAAAYFVPYLHAEETARAAMDDTDSVEVEAVAGGYRFDGPGTQTALVFYPGAKVDSVAYAPLMRMLAEDGVDCFLVEAPLHMAIFGVDAADGFMAADDYESWILAGHSLGGVTAASFVAAHPDAADALVLLASHPTKELPEGVRLLCVYGTEDSVLELDEYEKSRSYWPSDATELVIEGGNHAQFGYYGLQRGDGVATVSAQEQQAQTAAAIEQLVR